MKCCAPLLAAALASSCYLANGQSLVDGSNYPGLFSPADEITVDPPIPEGAVLGTYIGGTANGALGTYWQATAQGGVVLGSNLLGEIRVADTGAQVALSGSGLEFNISNDPGSLLGGLGVGLGATMSWQATATFDEPGEELFLLPNTVYRVVFDVDGSNGLLNSTLGLTPSFGIEMLDGAGNAIDAPAEDGTLVNIIGLELLGIIGSPPESGRAVVDFQTGFSVAAGAAGLRFTGSAILPATALNLGTNFATISNISITAVPEPSALALGFLGVVFTLRRRR